MSTLTTYCCDPRAPLYQHSSSRIKKLFIKPGDLVFPGQCIGYFVSGGQTKTLKYTKDEDGGVVQEICERFDRQSSGEVELFKYVKMAEAIKDGLVDVDKFDNFVVELPAPITAKYYCSDDKHIIQPNVHPIDEITEFCLALWDFDVVEWNFDADNEHGEYLTEDHLLVRMVHKEWSSRFKKKFSRVQKQEKISDLKRRIDALNAQLHGKEAEIARVQAEAQSLICDAQTTCDQILDDARRSADEIRSRALKDAEEQVEAARELKLNAQAETQRNQESAEGHAQSITVAAEGKAKQILQNAEREAQREILKAQAEAEAERQIVRDDTAKLKLNAVIDHLRNLHATGELADLLDLSALRGLYLSISELIRDSQGGVATPEAKARTEAFNRMDDMEAVYSYVDEKLKRLDANGTMSEDVRKSAIRDLTDIAKGMSRDMASE